MMLDGLRGYLQLATGLSDVTRERARAAARSLVAQGEAGVGAVLPEATRAQVSTLADELVAASRANRDLLVGLVRAEVERSVHRLGLVSAAELQAATRRAKALETRVRELEDALDRAQGAPKRASATKKVPAKKSTGGSSRAAGSGAQTRAKKSTSGESKG